MLESSQSSTGGALRYLKFPRLWAEKRRIFLSFPSFKRKSVALFEFSRTSNGRMLHYLKFSRLETEECCIIWSFPDLKRKSFVLFEVSRASNGRALHYLKFPGLHPEERCIIWSFPSFNRKSVVMNEGSHISTSSRSVEMIMHVKMTTDHWWECADRRIWYYSEKGIFQWHLMVSYGQVRSRNRFSTLGKKLIYKA